MPTATITRRQPRATVTGRHDRLFYGGMAVVMALTVFAGFAPTYFAPLASGRPVATFSGGPATGIVHAHAALFTAWVLLFIVQTSLVASRRVAVHRRLGIAGALVAAAMIVAGARIAVASAARGAAPPGVDPLAFLAIPLFDMLMFATFVTAALVMRKNAQAHKRLMLLAYISIIVAAVARLPGVLPLGPLVFFGLAFLFVLVGVVYDLLSRGRVHAVYLWGGTLLVASGPLRLAISGTGAWRALAELLTR